MMAGSSMSGFQSSSPVSKSSANRKQSPVNLPLLTEEPELQAEMLEFSSVTTTALHISGSDEWPCRLLPSGLPLFIQWLVGAVLRGMQMPMSSTVNWRKSVPKLEAPTPSWLAQLIQFVGQGRGVFDPAAALLRTVLVRVIVVEPDEDGLVDGHRLQVNERASQRDEHNFFVSRRIDAARFVGRQLVLESFAQTDARLKKCHLL